MKYPGMQLQCQQNFHHHAIYVPSAAKSGAIVGLKACREVLNGHCARAAPVSSKNAHPQIICVLGVPM